MVSSTHWTLMHSPKKGRRRPSDENSSRRRQRIEGQRTDGGSRWKMARKLRQIRGNSCDTDPTNHLTIAIHGKPTRIDWNVEGSAQIQQVFFPVLNPTKVVACRLNCTTLPVAQPLRSDALHGSAAPASPDPATDLSWSLPSGSSGISQPRLVFSIP